MEQMDLFAVVEEQEKETEAKLVFREWQGLPKEKFIREGDPMRAQVRGELARWYCSRWAQALHRCAGLPDGKSIWLNHIEAPEYWVINDEGNPCGEHIETCPYCGADLKNGAGDVVLVKADGGWWVIRGFLKGDSTNV